MRARAAPDKEEPPRQCRRIGLPRRSGGVSNIPACGRDERARLPARGDAGRLLPNDRGNNGASVVRCRLRFVSRNNESMRLNAAVIWSAAGLSYRDLIDVGQSGSWSLSDIHIFNHTET